MADVANAEVDLQIAEASQLVAEREWKLLGETIESTDIGEQLARKEPQRLEAEAMLTAALGKACSWRTARPPANDHDRTFQRAGSR